MNLLLDTHTFLWFLGGDPRLSSRARAAIEDLSNRRLFSIAGAWEIAIKVSLGKLTLTAPFHQLIPAQLHANGIELLQLRPEHIAELIALPMHHRDPFDRILVTQAMIERAVLVSADPLLDNYGVERIW
ncbi:type II toxin-antitoxin system VapC family toxin [Longimicrobium sp.]|uniref:type II toxin-antitoxin system VapC family toxin n=1 Tax=Longimicrobium sp. TaxID=2029185 RepID=UPI002E3758E1|nr:type II toxin-antitoxin system VapC family toxin [Longimicrobium sp.]HEX6040470.1 type II toxin-antitoxin system VapC family toxin [Longimicrobium sp.]